MYLTNKVQTTLETDEFTQLCNRAVNDLLHLNY